ncbi:MAG: hypothetical protein ACK2U1_06605 [Anaerolineales bacterium]|jgi:hypothetical protein
MTIFVKDPDAVLDYGFDWSDWLDSGAGEAISDYTIDADTGITVDSDSESSGVITVWLSGGTAGSTYAVRCEIETDDGRIDERTMIIKVQER